MLVHPPLEPVWSAQGLESWSMENGCSIMRGAHCSLARCHKRQAPTRSFPAPRFVATSLITASAAGLREIQMWRLVGRLQVRGKVGEVVQPLWGSGVVSSQIPGPGQDAFFWGSTS